MTGIPCLLGWFRATRSSETSNGIALGSIMAAIISIHAVRNTIGRDSVVASAASDPCGDVPDGVVLQRYSSSRDTGAIIATAIIDGGAFRTERERGLMSNCANWFSSCRS
jgi:hypothetical protein